MDLLPKHMCHRCSYKLEEFHKFYTDCLKTDANLKSQLSWMRKEGSKEKTGVPMVHIENTKIKGEPPDYDVYDLDPIVENVDYINAMNSVSFPVNDVQTDRIHNEIAYATYGNFKCCCDKKDQSRQSISDNYRESLGRQSKDDIGSSTSTNISSHSNHRNKDTIKDEGGYSKKTLPRGRVRKKVIIDVQNSSTGVLVRNLRHRKYSVHSFDKKRSAPKKTVFKTKSILDEVTLPIKVEENQSVNEGRTLRPRNRTIDYLGRKKRNRVQKSPIKVEPISDDEESNAKRQKLTSLELSPKNKKRVKAEKNTKRSIKQEVHNDLENVRINNASVSKKLNSFNARPRKLIVDTNVNMKASHLQNRNIFQVIKELNSIKKITKNKLKSTNTSIYSQKCLRSHDSHLRNGKVISMLDLDMKIGIKRLHRNSRYRSTGARKLEEQTSMKKISAPVSLTMTADCIKHYCEKCNLSFCNKELFKLHACYD